MSGGKSSPFALSAEVIPPRNNSAQATMLQQIDALIQAGAQFLAVTKGAGGSLRGGSLPIAQAIKEQFHTPCIAHFTCRDLTPIEVENQLIDHHYFGIRNILALRGDPPVDQPNWQPKEGSYPYAYQLIEQIRGLNRGVFMNRSGGTDNSDFKTDFCIGAAAYPEHPQVNERFDFFKLKVEAGAEYGITQMLFDDTKYSDFIAGCAQRRIAVPILPGTCLLRSQEHAARIAQRFQVSLPPALLQALPLDSDPRRQEKAIVVFEQFIRRLKSAGAPGVHIFVLSELVGSCGLLGRIRG